MSNPLTKMRHAAEKLHEGYDFLQSDIQNVSIALGYCERAKEDIDSAIEGLKRMAAIREPK